VRAAALALAVGLLLAGCGGDGDDPGTTEGDAAAETSLQIVVTGVSGVGGGGRSLTLFCDPPSGAHPDPEAACEALEENPEALAPVPEGTACTEIHGGPERAEVTGTLRGDSVRATFDRTNGCEIARWDALAPLFAAG
jgi:Subtilisin inhibitor-like